MFKRKKIGLALGSGGAKGFAHIGVLKVLEKNKIPIDFISGTSMGALIGGLYCKNPDAKKLEKDILKKDFKKILDYTLSKTGLVKGNKIHDLLKDELGNIEFKELKIPLYVTSFDIGNNREVIFHKGSVIKAIRASISIPGLFIPVENKKRILVDGGVIDPIPTEILRRNKADIVIAVNVNSMRLKNPVLNEEAVNRNDYKKIPSMIRSASRSMQVIISESSKYDLDDKKADFIININTEKIGTLDFTKAKEAIKLGENTAKRHLRDIDDLRAPNIFKEFLNELKKNLNVNVLDNNIDMKIINKSLKKLKI
ncbi:MAG: patatin-like phospholipase family protein [Nanoarchaeota archaeon]|nr:patatin-like phospholipase family protein [Nanoarchaeota archaeon]